MRGFLKVELIISHFEIIELIVEDILNRPGFVKQVLFLIDS